MRHVQFGHSYIHTIDKGAVGSSAVRVEVAGGVEAHFLEGWGPVYHPENSFERFFFAHRSVSRCHLLWAWTLLHPPFFRFHTARGRALPRTPQPQAPRGVRLAGLMSTVAVLDDACSLSGGGWRGGTMHAL